MEQFLPTLTVAGVLGFLAPLLASTLKKSTWPSKVNQIVALLVSVALAVVALLVTGGFKAIPVDQDPVIYWILVCLAVIAVAQIAYKLVWQGTAVEQNLTALGSPSLDATPVDPDYAAKHQLNKPVG